MLEKNIENEIHVSVGIELVVVDMLEMESVKCNLF